MENDTVPFRSMTMSATQISLNSQHTGGMDGGCWSRNSGRPSLSHLRCFFFFALVGVGLVTAVDHRHLTSRCISFFFFCSSFACSLGYRSEVASQHTAGDIGSPLEWLAEEVKVMPCCLCIYRLS